MVILRSYLIVSCSLTTSASPGVLKKAPSRFGMKSRGSSFTAFEDEYDPDLDIGGMEHLRMNSTTEHPQEGSALPAKYDAIGQSRHPDAMQPTTSAVNASKHRRTTR